MCHIVRYTLGVSRSYTGNSCLFTDESSFSSPLIEVVIRTLICFLRIDNSSLPRFVALTHDIIQMIRHYR